MSMTMSGTIVLSAARCGNSWHPAAKDDVTALTSSQQVGLVVRLDQFPRSIFRGRSYAFNEKGARGDVRQVAFKRWGYQQACGPSIPGQQAIPALA